MNYGPPGLVGFTQLGRRHVGRSRRSAPASGRPSANAITMVRLLGTARSPYRPTRTPRGAHDRDRLGYPVTRTMLPAGAERRGGSLRDGHISGPVACACTNAACCWVHDRGTMGFHKTEDE